MLLERYIGTLEMFLLYREISVLGGMGLFGLFLMSIFRCMKYFRKFRKKIDFWEAKSLNFGPNRGNITGLIFIPQTVFDLICWDLDYKVLGIISGLFPRAWFAMHFSEILKYFFSF